MTHFSNARASDQVGAPISVVRPIFRMIGLLAISLMVCGAPAMAKNGGGGTAKPPKPGTPAPPTSVTVTPPPAPAVPPPSFSADVGTIVGFGVTGFVQSATLDTSGCPEKQRGGTVVVNGRNIVVPCNTIVQFPANTLSWWELFQETQGAGLALDGTAVKPNSAGFTYPSTEISVAGNIVGGKSIAGLITFSQQSLNNGSGFITRIDPADGAIYVGDAASGTDQAKLIINDPEGVFGRKQSPDGRFSVDNENPTIIANSGYPMCVPRTTDGSDDLQCPKKNRPLVVSGHCRNFLDAGVTSPAGWELAAPVAGQTICSSFVMEDPTAPGAKTDARLQAPFMVGDYIEYSGTLLHVAAATTPDVISVHTIHANVGIFTQPGTLPVYLSIEEAIIGTDAVPIAGTAAGLPALEGQDRFVIVGTTTDVKTPVDVYLVDSIPQPAAAPKPGDPPLVPAPGTESHRWITPEAMTGGIAPGTAPFGGGIMTQLTGPQPGRFRLRANKPPAGLLVSPTRNVRVVARTLCAPAKTTGFYDINGTGPIVGGTTDVPCLERDPAGGVFAGEYLAPVSEFIFPENVVAGDRPVPYNFWSLGFLMNGEGPNRGRLSPTPW